ncbi:MAG: HAD family hydrolase [Nitrospirae bacterium]|nr:HAD family hydrolase [Nitrospirota bacterium]
MRYRAVLFDFCDTLLHFDAERLPLVEVDHRPTRSTAHAIYDALGASPPIQFNAFFACLTAVTAEIAAQRDVDCREVTSQERFRRVMDRLGAEAGPDTADRLVVAHMSRLATALVLPSHHRTVLESLARTHRLAVVTNFDHAPTVHDVLRRERIDAFFEVVVISGEVGWRKPHRVMFETALQRLGVRADVALFVGDNYELDVVGATQAGLAAMWYTRGRTVDVPAAQAIVADLADLGPLLRRP